MDYYTAVHLFLKGREVHSLFLASEITPKKLKGAAEYAPSGAEHPIAMLDDTVFGSGSEGAFLTSEALYTSKPRQRILLSAIGRQPVFPEGRRSPGVLSTSAGDFVVPRFSLEDLTGGFCTLVDAISYVNGGEVESKPTLPPIEGPLRDLAMRSLYHSKIKVIPDIPTELLNAALSALDLSLDHLADEQVLAVVDGGIDSSVPELAVLTDRRISWRHGSDRADVPYAAITAAAPRSTALGRALYLAWSSPTELAFIGASDAVEPLARFFNDLLRYPPHQRYAPVAAIEPSDGDPFAAKQALSRLAPGPRVATILHVIDGLTAQIPPPTGQNLVRRAILLYHTLLSGRGAHQGWYTSPLSVNDFVFAFNAVVGPPFTHSWNGPTLTLDYSVQGRRDIGGAVASSAAGLAALAIFGVGWYSVPRVAMRGLRLTLQDMTVATGFSMQGLVGEYFLPLESCGPEIATMVLNSLPLVEAQVLLLRSLYGPSAPPEHLYGEGPQGIYHRLAQLVPFQPDLAAFRLAPAPPGR